MYTLLVMLMLKSKSRIISLNDFCRINLNDVRRAGAHDDGVFNVLFINLTLKYYQLSDIYLRILMW